MKKILAILALAVLLPGCGYNTLQTRDEQVKEAWANVLVLYKKRFDLLPNLMSTVQGYADHEKSTFTEIAQARASVGAIKATPELVNDPEAFKKFTAAQDGLAGVLQRLLMVSERYPELKANANFMDLQKQLRELEDQIALQKKRYNKEVKDFNIVVRNFPTNITAMAFSIKTKDTLSEGDVTRMQDAPKLEFNKKSAPVAEAKK